MSLLPRRPGWLPWLALGLVLGHGALAFGAAEKAPWETRFMTAPGAEVQTAARALPRPSNTNVHVLFEERTVEYRADGTATSRYRQVYQLVTEAGIDGLDKVAAGWSPWYQERPQLRARVIAAGGKTYQIDPKTIEESSPQDEDTFGDSRTLRAPLPGVGKGAVVEIEVVQSEHKRPFAAGWVHRFYFGGTEPVARARLVIDKPVTMALRTVERRLPSAMTAQRMIKGDREIMTWESGPMEAFPDIEPGTPSDALPWAYVGYATGKSWAAVSETYATLVEKQMGAPVWADWVRDLRRTVKNRNDLVAQLVDRLAREIRYTGVEFGESSIVPRPPQETLRSGFGDCKDKSLVLISLLRTAGIDAQLVLLRAGSGPDVDPDLPGLGPFNHAIVYVPGPAPMWIDPTYQFAPAGELPIPDLERLALPTGRRTTALVRTPGPTSSANLVREVREVTLREEGPARVVETTESRGTPAQSDRAYYHATDRKQIEERLAEYAHEHYDSSSLIRFDTSDPTRVATPFRLVLEMDAPKVGSVWPEGAEVILRAPLLSRLPEMLRDPERKGQSISKRTADLALVEPYVYEVEYHITPPHGYAPASLPSPEEYALGPARVTHRFSSNAKGVVTAVLRFDAGKARLSAADVQAFRDGVRQFYKQNIPVVSFVQTGAQHLSSNRVRSALDEFRRLDREHPRQALHQSQIAEAFLEAGLGAAARSAARAAVALDATSAYAWRILGWVLEHDLLGRRMRPGWDSKGAEDAYRHAVALKATDRVARASLAILLEHDATTGERNYPKPRLDEVISIYEGIRKDDSGGSELDINYLLALFHRGRLGDVIKNGRALAGANTGAAGLVLASIAIQSGASAALKEATSLVSNAARRPESLREAAAQVMHAGRYPLAAVLYREAARGHDNSTALRNMSEAMERTRPRSELKLDGRTATSAAKLALWWLTAPADKAARERAKSVIPREMIAEIDRAQELIPRMMRRIAERAGLPLDAVLDMMISGELISDGDARWGYRVTSASGAGSGTWNLTLVPRDGGWHVLGVGGEFGLLPAEISRLLTAGDRNGARFLLDLAVEGMSLGTADDPLSAQPLARVWTKGLAGDDASIKIATAVMEGMSDWPAPALPQLERCRSQPPSEQIRISCEQALVTAYSRLKRPKDALTVAAEMHARYPRSVQATLQHATYQLRTKQPAEAVKTLGEWLGSHADDAPAMRLLGQAHANAKDLQKADEVLSKLVTSARRHATDLNQLAWMRLARGRLGDETVKLARQAVELSGRNDPAILNTLAAVLAEAGKPEEAREVLLESIEAVDEPRSCDWYVAGRIAEGFGVIEAARESYSRVKLDEGEESDDASSCWALVQRRLTALKK